MFIPSGFDSPELIEQTDLRIYKDQLRQSQGAGIEEESVDIYYDDIVVTATKKNNQQK